MCMAVLLIMSVLLNSRGSRTRRHSLSSDLHILNMRKKKSSAEFRAARFLVPAGTLSYSFWDCLLIEESRMKKSSACPVPSIATPLPPPAPFAADKTDVPAPVVDNGVRPPMERDRGPLPPFPPQLPPHRPALFPATVANRYASGKPLLTNLDRADPRRPGGTRTKCTLRWCRLAREPTA